MATPTFIQNSRINRVIFQINDGHLLVSTKPLVGPFQEHRFALRNLDPDYRPGFTRNYALLLTPLVLAVLCAGVFRGLWQQSLLPREAIRVPLMYSAIWFAASIAGAIRGSRRIEYFQFNNIWKRPAVFIIRERSQSAECADFIAALVAHIEVAQSDLPAAERKLLLERLVDDRGTAANAQPGQNLWLASIWLGIFAVVFPLLLGGLSQDPSLFPIMFLLCVGGASLCIFSFLANEPRRWWSVVGLVLSLLPPFF